MPSDCPRKNAVALFSRVTPDEKILATCAAAGVTLMPMKPPSNTVWPYVSLLSELAGVL